MRNSDMVSFPMDRLR